MRKRNRFIKKSCKHVDEIPGGDALVIYCYGTLYGEWLSGLPFSGIRIIDRFEVVNRRLRNRKVWNDLAESFRQG